MSQNKQPDSHTSANAHGILASMISWFAHNPIAANFLMLLVIVLGFNSYQHINKESFPELEPNFVGVNVAYNTGDAKQNEEGITLKIENALEQIDGIKRITSFSQPTGSRVTVEKRSDYPLDELVKDVKNAVDSIPNLPANAEKPVITEASFLKDALWVDIFGDVDKRVLMTTAQRLKTALLKQPDIADVRFSGMPEQIISVEVADSQLQRYGLTISDISNIINAESVTSLSTSIRDGKKKIRLAAAEQGYFAEDFAQIPIKTFANGTQLKLADVASIQESIEDDPQILARYNGKATVGIKMYSDKNTDIAKLVQQAKTVVDAWQPKLPQGVQMVYWLDQSKNINERLQLLFGNAMFGFALVFIILALFLHIKIAFWVAAGLPFIFFGTFIFMGDSFVGLTINYITTFGFIMALGIVVDDAVVVGESIYTVRQRFGDTVASTVAGTLAVSKPTILGVITTVVTFLSLANITGDMGKIYAQFGYVVSFCLLLSIVESKFILPAHLAHLNTQSNHIDNHTQSNQQPSTLARYNPWRYLQKGADILMQRANSGFQRLISLLLRFRYATLLVLLATFVLVVGMPLSGKIRMVFFPDIPGDIFMVQSEVTSEAGYRQNHANLAEIEQRLYEVDKALVQKAAQDTTASEKAAKENTSNTTAAQQGKQPHAHTENVNPLSAKTGLKSVQVYSDSDLKGRILIELKPNAPYDSAALIKQWESKTGIPAGTQSIKFISNFMRGDNFKVEIQADDMQSISAAGRKLKEILQSTKGVSGIEDNLTPNQPQIRFRLTPDGRALGFTTAEVAKQVLQNFGGGVVQRFQRDKDEVKVRVRYPEEARTSLASVQTANVRTPSGHVVPLSTVATMSQEFTTEQIRRIDGQRAGFITAQINKDIIAPAELVQQIQKNDVPALKAQFPSIDISFAGEAEQEAETAASMKSTFAITLLIIYMILAIALNSYTQPLLIMAVIPFGIVGAILGHWISGLSISIFSLNGILALTGVVINDSLLLISKFNENRRQGMFASAAIAEAAASRFRAVVLTSLTTFFGLIPLLFETSRQAQFLKPAAASLAYGILFATVITLVLIPLLVNISQDLKFWQRG